MSWTKALLAGVAGGIVLWLAYYGMHGFIMAETYTGLPEVFTQEQANPLSFLLISVCITLAAALFFAKTRSCWKAGIAGGVTFGFWLGLVLFFQPFYDTLVVEGFPYYLAWCQGGISMIGSLLVGAVFGLIYKQE